MTFTIWEANLKKFLAIAGAMALAGCVSTQEMPLAPNVVRIDTQAKGLLFTGQTVPQTMRAAANATLTRGYTHFKFADANLQQGSEVTGAIGSSSGNYSGSYGNGMYSGNSSGFGSTSIMRAPTATASGTVIMFHEKDREAKTAFRAEDILRQYAQ
jgi:hypothetical protein